ncbi:unnamed protein product [marine sediment metagenome]|uniref:Uncharacterized protein n=1 Tax=marine sediment metagenome TaxID=412755 RepID=X1M8A6_9ZZZZ
MPYVKILFLPYISAILPKGTRNIAAARRYEVATQLNKTAFIANSCPIDGSAMLMEELIKGVTKEANAATNKAALLVATLFILILSIII